MGPSSMKGFCDHCYSWGTIADEERNMCTDCQERELGRAMRTVRNAKDNVRPLSRGDIRGRG